MADTRWSTREAARALLDAEEGTIRREAPNRVALVYPSPYRAAMSSLGYQTMYRLLNQLPDELQRYRESRIPLLTLERDEPVGNYSLIAFSVAYELEIAGLIHCLNLAGIPPLRKDREAGAPLIVVGGPLTFSNPAPLAPFADVIVMGEGEDNLVAIATHELAFARRAQDLASAFQGRAGIYIPAHDGDRVPPVGQADDKWLPAHSQIITSNTELRSMYLTEAVRGCSRGCTYCVMRRTTNGGMRLVPADVILGGIPESARRVGLVGASVTDHPEIAKVVRTIVDGGREIGISSLRAERLTDELVSQLAKGGYKTLTVALDGASERLRTDSERRTDEKALLRAARMAKTHGLRTLKVYMMIGLPTETDADIDELARFTLELSQVHPRVALGVAPFVAKRNTPLDGTDFAGISTVDARLKRLRKGLVGRATVRPTSARWAWVEYMLAQGDHRAGLAVLQATHNGESFAAYKRAFADHGCKPSGPIARVPTTPELVALRKIQHRRAG